MPHCGAVSRRNLIKGLRDLGFEGPETGTGDHPEFMVKGSLQLKLPNPHRGDIGLNLLERILKQAGISRQEWESV